MHCIRHASSATDRFSRIWSPQHLSLTTKLRLYSSSILAVLLYSCKTWTLTKVDWKRLESFHLRCQRRILGIKWSNLIMNTEVCTRSGLQSILLMVHWRLLSLFAHVALMLDNVPAKAVLHVHVACTCRTALAEMEFHPSQTSADRAVVLPLPDLFRLWPVSWRRPQLCPGSGHVENVRYGLLGLVLTTMTMAVLFNYLFRLQLLSEDSYLLEGLQSADKTKTHTKAKLQNAPTFTGNGSHSHVCLLLVLHTCTNIYQTKLKHGYTV